jgi:SulP family sulfate permease
MKLFNLSQFFSFFRPRLIDALQGYNRGRLSTDVTAGLTVGIVALPLAIAFAIASGAKPEAGIFTAIIAGFLISALGGSRVQIGGPTGAFIVIVYGIIAQYGYANLLICTIMAGFMLLAMGAFKLGTLIKYFPKPLIIGFTNGIAVLIALSEIKDFLGLKTEALPAEFFQKIAVLWHALPSIDLPTLALAGISALFIWFYPKHWAKRAPSPIVVLALGTTVVAVFNLPLETIGTRFGGIPQGLPEFSAPTFSIGELRHLIMPAFTIALLGAIESLLSAAVADGMIEDRHDPNQELMAQGIANIVTPFFGGIPATGAIARTATNVRSGASSPISGIVHALVLLFIVLIAAPLAQYIPLASLAAILLIVSINMGEWEVFSRLKTYPRQDTIVLLLTFVFTVIFDLTVAVEVGLLLAGIFFINNMTELSHVHLADAAAPDRDLPHDQRPVPPGALVYRLYGALFFGVVDKLEQVLHQQHTEPEVLILNMSEVISMDASALHVLEDLHKKLERRSKHLVLCGPHTQPYFLMHQAGFFDQLGADNLTANLDDALTRATVLLQKTNT